MSELVMARADVRLLIWHLALYGLSAILDESELLPDLRVSWTPGMQPHGRVVAVALDDSLLGDVVRRHAERHASNGSWVTTDVELSGTLRGLMSPRLTRMADDEWRTVQRERHRQISALGADGRWLDLRFLAALGEPCYWSVDPKGAARQDDGASRLEMQPRNQGSEFVGSRLRKLAVAVAARTPSAVTSGLRGTTTVDEIGKSDPSRFTSTGLSNVKPTDNALAWCALWGISQLPTVSRIDRPAATSGHIGRTSNEWFYAPVWHEWFSPARLRTVLASEQLRDVAAAGLELTGTVEVSRQLSATAWLAARHVAGIMRFPIQLFGGKAKERRAMAGSPHAVGGR